MYRGLLLPLLASAVLAGAGKKHHHHHHHHHAAIAQAAANATAATANETAGTAAEIVAKMKAIEQKIDAKEAEAASAGVQQGRLIVNGPLPADFAKTFADAVASATGCDPNVVKLISTHGVGEAEALVQKAPAFVQLAVGAGEVEIVFEAPAAVVAEVEAQAADENSKLVNGPLNKYLTADDGAEEAAEAPAKPEVAPAGKALEVDTEMPYGELEPFGREDTAQELTDQSIHESDEMVDQLERAEVAEEKRAVFRAITRLRGAAITSFDGIARSQTGNIDEYNHNHQWRTAHPLHHLADEESDVAKWAFPNNAD